MRKRFEQQIPLGVVPIVEVSIEQKSRHQLAPVLTALQYLFTTPELNEGVFKLLEGKVLSGKKKTGRLGLSLWEILVLGSVRLSLDIDYDFLLDQANNHEALRGIMGVGKSGFTRGKAYKLQTLKDNVGLLDEATLREINLLVVQAGHNLIKKKEEKEGLDLRVKMDSYVLEGNIHFPTDLNLLWDSGRKCLDVIDYFFKGGVELGGWRKRQYTRSQFRKAYRRSSEVHRKKGKDYKERLEASVEGYLEAARALSVKIHRSAEQLCVLVLEGRLSVIQALAIRALLYYVQMLDKHRDLVGWRILEGGKIPHQEKVFSIFEPHMEWINKGKLHKKVELGHNVAIATDQYQFIVDYEVMMRQSDVEVGLLVGRRIIEKYKRLHRIYSMSFDRGFYSSLVKAALSKEVELVIMPKRGKKGLKQQVEESTDTFVRLRKAHSAVEANINQLEHNGLNRCPDKGERGFKRYVGLGVLAYNLQHLGKLLIQQGQGHKQAKLKELERLKRAA